MTTINQRIALLIKDFGGDSESGFAKRIDVSSSVMFNIVNPKGRNSYPSGPVLEKILDLEKEGSKDICRMANAWFGCYVSSRGGI